MGRNAKNTGPTATTTMRARVPLLAALSLVLAACSALESYSVRVAEGSCDDVLVCTVYGDRGKVQSPCISTGRDTIYPGDPRWPYTTPGVCDAVRDGKVISTRAAGSTPP